MSFLVMLLYYCYCFYYSYCFYYCFFDCYCYKDKDKNSGSNIKILVLFSSNIVYTKAKLSCYDNCQSQS